MKSLRHLVRSAGQWQLPKGMKSLLRPSANAYKESDLQDPADIQPLPSRPAKAVVSPCRALRRPRSLRHPRLFFLMTVAALTATMGQRFYDQPELQVQTQAPDTIFAPADATVPDLQTTEEQRRAARNGVLRVLMVDAAASETIQRDLSSLIQQATALRRQSGPLPFVATHALSTPVQRYLRSTSKSEWQAIDTLLSSDLSATEAVGTSLNQQPQSLSPLQQRALQELRSYQQRNSTQELGDLRRQIDSARRLYQQATLNLDLVAEKPIAVPNNPLLLELTESEWASTQSGLRKAGARILTQGLMPGLPDELKQQAVQLQLEGQVPVRAEALAETMLLEVLQPNLVEDSERTRLQAEMAAEAVDPVTVSVSAGEAIVREGETITQADFVLLDHFNLSQRRFNWVGLGSFAILVGGSVAIFVVVEERLGSNLRQRDYLLLIAMVLGTAGLSVVGATAYSLPAVGLLAGSFYGRAIGTLLVVLLTLLLPVGIPVGTVALLASSAGALACSLLASRLRSREELALLGGGVGLTQGVVYLLLTLIFSPVSPSAWYGILTGAAMQGIYGVISSIVALGLSPYLEHLFDLVTPIRLAELANPNRPLLKRLASEAPGTFQHTLFVASLAEAAARSLGCNVELVRTGTLYHDIGKMHDPLGFIENQMGGPNKHDQIDNPWRSARIIKKHVSEGLVMARKHRLPRAVQSFIPEHQGTMQISYFYHQAQEKAAVDDKIALKEADFRYDGPTPQSPETGIVMLADSCEAALRSLTDATPEEALAMVNRILRARWKDDQLKDSGLTREHMSVIASIFVQVWQQYHHKRIAYPKAAMVPKPTA